MTIQSDHSDDADGSTALRRGGCIDHSAEVHDTKFGEKGAGRLPSNQNHLSDLVGTLGLA
jgi:hypothetical protein